MTDPRTLGPWLRRFLEEHIVSERNLARNTQLSYRDTLVLLLRFVSRQTRKAADRLTVRDLSAERVRAFLLHLEQERGCLPQTRNQRLAALRAFRALRRQLQPRARGMVRADPRHPAEEGRASGDRLSGEAGNRCPARRAEPRHAAGPP